MRSARFIIGLAAFLLSLGLSPGGIPSGKGDRLWTRLVRVPAAESAEGGWFERIRPAARALGERSRARRDRISRRLGRGSELLPHFGDYTIHESGFRTTRFTRAHGVMSVELIDDCGDWTLQEKWDLALVDQADQSLQSTILYRASEVGSAGKFVFAYSRDHLGERSDFIGDVIPINDGYMARYLVPEIPDLFMPSDLIFPIEHLRQILSQASRGRTEFEAAVFDGANRVPYRAVAAISQPLRQDDSNPRVVAARTELDERTSDRLPDGQHWPVRVDYFPLDDDYAPPVFSREFLLHESGVILSFHVDYGDIQVDARLKNLDIRAAEACPE